MHPSDDPRSDVALLAAIAQNDPSAFPTLYHRHRDWLYRLAYRFSQNPEDAQDVVQEVFIYLVKSAPKITLRVRLTTFLYPAVKHTALNLRRKRHRTTPFSIQIESEMIAPPDTPDTSESRSHLAEVLSNLPETHREILLMRFVDDLTLEEIAAAAQIPLGTAKSRLHHALKHLQSDPRTLRYFTD